MGAQLWIELSSIHSGFFESRALTDSYCSITETVDLRFSKGTAIIFPHNYLHEGTTVETESKYILRTDVMFCNETLPTLDEETAFNLVKEAGELEGSNPDQAVKLYHQAFRLCPDIERYV